MALPAHRRPGRLTESFPAIGWGEPVAAEFDELFDRMNELLASAAATPAGAWSPLADMHETDEAYVIEADLPGIKREDIDVEVGDQHLRITGDYGEREREGVLRRSTRRTGHFEYRALLPVGVNAEEVKAQLADGVLTVTVPKAQSAKSRHVDITES
jgi:HSP20 family protein